MEVDTDNDCLVALGGGGIMMVMPPKSMEMIDKNKALRLAAWIVCMVNDDEQFKSIYEAVVNS